MHNRCPIKENQPTRRKKSATIGRLLSRCLKEKIQELRSGGKRPDHLQAAIDAAIFERQQRWEKQQAELCAQNDELLAQQAQLEYMAECLKASQELQAQATRRAEELFHGVPVACFSYDVDGVIFAWNAAAERLYGYRAYEVVFRPMWEAMDMLDAKEPALQLIEQVFLGECPQPAEWTFRDRNGDLRHFQTSNFPIRNSAGEVIAGIGATVDLTTHHRYEEELKQANDRLHALAITDGLTGLDNHRSFLERMEREVIHSTQTSTPFSIILLDVDSFKKLNDTHGHPVGDKVLQAVAAVMRSVAPTDALAARYGGEEFVIVMSHTRAEQAMAIGEKLRAEIESAEPEGLSVTVSVGVSTWCPEVRGRAEMIAQADKALYISKNLGKNRVTHASVFAQSDRTAA